MDVERDGCAAASVTSTSQRIPATGLAAFAIVALNACGGGGSGGGDTAPPPPPAAAVTSVTLTCTSTELHPSDTSQCTANVQGTGAFCTAVEWSTEGGDTIEGITVESQPFRRGDSSGPDGAFELRLLEGTTGVAVLAITATCGRVGYYGPNGFTASRKDATEIEIGHGNVAGIEIRLPIDVNDLCVSIGVEN